MSMALCKSITTAVEKNNVDCNLGKEVLLVEAIREACVWVVSLEALQGEKEAGKYSQG